MILKAISRNIGIIKTHVIVFLFKSFIIYMSLVPLHLAMNRFFSGRTINDSLFANADLNAFHEFFQIIFPDMSWYGFPQYLTLILVGIVIFFFFLFLFIDGFIDAGMLCALEIGKNRSFIKGMRQHGFSFFKLRLFNVILFLVITVTLLALSFYFYLSDGFNVSIGVFALLAVPFMFALKMFDHGKYLILRENKKVGRAFLISLKSIFNNKKQILILNSQTLLFFFAGYFLYMFFDGVLIVDTAEKIWLMVILQQVALFGKQVLRYSYLAGIGNVIKTEENIFEINITTTWI